MKREFVKTFYNLRRYVPDSGPLKDGRWGDSLYKLFYEHANRRERIADAATEDQAHLLARMWSRSAEMPVVITLADPTGAEKRIALYKTGKLLADPTSPP